MIHKIMSEEDLACLQEFIDAGNGEAIYEYVDENPGVAKMILKGQALVRRSMKFSRPMMAAGLMRGLTDTVRRMVRWLQLPGDSKLRAQERGYDIEILP